MDKWKPAELEKMKLGGNQHARLFFESQPDYRSNWTLTEKYNSRAAALLRDKIATESEGRSWSVATSSARNYHAPSGIGRCATSDYLPSYKSSAISGLGDNMQAIPTCHSDLEAWLNDPGQKARNEKFFSRTMAENMDRPAGVPPSRGGRYEGFGNSPITTTAPKPMGSAYDDAMSTLMTGWSTFSMLASVAAKKTNELASTATEKTRQLGQTVQAKIKEGHLIDSISDGVSNLSTKVQTYLQSSGEGIGEDFQTYQESPVQYLHRPSFSSSEVVSAGGAPPPLVDSYGSLSTGANNLPDGWHSSSGRGGASSQAPGQHSSGPVDGQTTTSPAKAASKEWWESGWGAEDKAAGWEDFSGKNTGATPAQLAADQRFPEVTNRRSGKSNKFD